MTLRFLKIAVVCAIVALSCASCDLLFGSKTTADTTKPGESSGLLAQAGDGRVVLNWADPTDADLHHLELTYSPGGSGAIRIASGVGQAVVENLANGTAYQFTLRAVDNVGNAGSGISATATPHPTIDLQAPDDVTELAPSYGDGYIDLTWNNPTDADLASVEITPSWGSVVTLPATRASYRFTGLSNGRLYLFTVRAVDGAGNVSAGISAQATPSSIADTIAPEAPSSFTAAAGNGVVTLSWADPVAPDLSRIELAWNSGPAAPLVVAPGAATVQVAGLINGTAYTFTARAVDKAGNKSSPATSAQVVPAAGADGSPPEILFLSYAPNPAYVNQQIRIVTVVRDLQSAVTLSYDIHNDGTYGDSPNLSYATAGTRTIRVRASSGGGSADRTVDVAVAAIAGLTVVHHGTVTIEGADAVTTDIAALLDEGCTVIQGDLNIQNTTRNSGDPVILSSLAGLEKVAQVTGSVYIGNNPDLTDLAGLANLVDIGANLQFHVSSSSGNAALATIPAWNLRRVGGSLNIQYNPLLSSLGGLSNLVSVGGYLRIYDNDALLSLYGLHGLDCTSSNTLEIAYNKALTDVSALANFRCHGLYLVDNEAIQHLAGLVGVDGLNAPYIYIDGNKSLIDLDGLSGVSTLTGYVHIYNNENLGSLAGFEPSGYMPSFVDIQGNPALTNVSALKNLTSINYLTMINNDALATLKDSPGSTTYWSLKTIRGDLALSDNLKLANLSGLENVSTVEGSITVTANGDASGGLSALTGLSGLRMVRGNMAIRNNPRLSDYSAIALEDIKGWIELESNGASLATASTLAGFDVGIAESTIKVFNHAVKGLSSLAGLSVNTLCGDLIVQNNPTLASLGSSIKTINGGVVLENNVALTDLSALTALSGDSNLTNIIVRNCAVAGLTGFQEIATVTGNATIDANPSLASLAGLDGLRTIQGSFSITSNPLLDSLTGIENLATVGNGLSVQGNRLSAASAVAPLGGIAVNGTMNFCDNTGLTTLTGMSNITVTNGYLWFGLTSSGSAGTTILQNADGLTNLLLRNSDLGFENSPNLSSIAAMSIDPASTVNGYGFRYTNLGSLAGIGAAHPRVGINIVGNTSLSDITALTGTTALTGSLIFNGNTFISSLAGLEGIASIGGSVDIEGNSNLTGLSLGALETIGSNLTITDNNKLQHLTGLNALTAVNGYLDINGNDLLIDLSASSGLTKLAEVKGGIRIWYNNVLTKVDLPLLATVGSVDNWDLFFYDDVDTNNKHAFVIGHNPQLANVIVDSATGNGLDALTSMSYRGFSLYNSGTQSFMDAEILALRAKTFRVNQWWW